MKSEWRVSKIPVGDCEYIYGIYRLLDVAKTDHSGNREELGRVFDDPELAEDVCRIKNEEATQ